MENKRTEDDIPKDINMCFSVASDMIYEDGKLPYYIVNACPYFRPFSNNVGVCELKNITINNQVKGCGISLNTK